MVALDAETVLSLREHVARQSEESARWGAAYDDQGLVFCHEIGRPIDLNWLTKMFPDGQRGGPASHPVPRAPALVGDSGTQGGGCRSS